MGLAEGVIVGSTDGSAEGSGSLLPLGVGVGTGDKDGAGVGVAVGKEGGSEGVGLTLGLTKGEGVSRGDCSGCGRLSVPCRGAAAKVSPVDIHTLRHSSRGNTVK